MLNYRLLNTLLNFRFIKKSLIIISCLGLGTLADTVLFLIFSMLIGPWLTLGILALLTAGSVYAVFRLIEHRSSLLKASLAQGFFDEKFFIDYICALVASPFIMLPGMVNTLFGLIILLPVISRYIAKLILKITGINWRESYEFLRLKEIAE